MALFKRIHEAALLLLKLSKLSSKKQNLQIQCTLEVDKNFKVQDLDVMSCGFI